jgi:hypothetical protein
MGAVHLDRSWHHFRWDRGAGMPGLLKHLSGPAGRNAVLEHGVEHAVRTAALRRDPEGNRYRHHQELPRARRSLSSSRNAALSRSR